MGLPAQNATFIFFAPVTGIFKHQHFSKCSLCLWQRLISFLQHARKLSTSNLLSSMKVGTNLHFVSKLNLASSNLPENPQEALILYLYLFPIVLYIKDFNKFRQIIKRVQSFQSSIKLMGLNLASTQ